MFEQLIKDAASQFSLSTGNVAIVVRGLLALMTDERTGGPEGFVDRFRRAGLGDVITSWFGGRQGMPLTPAQVETALEPATLDRLAASSGLTRSVVSSLTAFLLPRLVGRLTPNGIFPPTPALLAQVSGYVDRPLGVPSDRAGRRAWPRWVPWAAAALLAIVAWLAFRGSASTVDPELTLSNRNGRVVYSGLVRDEAARAAIVETLQRTFGEGNVDGSIRVDRNVKRSAWLPHVGELMAALNTPGIVDVSIRGDAIRVSGWLSADQRESLAGRLRGIFGEGATIDTRGDPEEEAVRTANRQAITALGAVGTSGTSPGAVADALNMAIISFPAGSAEIPAPQMAIIRTSADAIKQAPAGSTFEIGGHTDNTGDPAANIALSQARADSVKRALVEAGVPDAMLTAKGYGATQPRASNDTEYGRFQNRRIEYTVIQ